MHINCNPRTKENFKILEEHEYVHIYALLTDILIMHNIIQVEKRNQNGFSGSIIF
jgi:hypothetical protein